MFDELKFKIQKGDALVRVMIINFLIFFPLLLIYVISYLSNTPAIFNAVNSFIAFHSDYWDVITKPWTIISYGFTHYDVLHFIFNMFGLYWFGGIIQEYIGEKRFMNLYILGTIVGGILFFVGMNTFPLFANQSHSLVGASAAIFALAVATVTLLPAYTIFFPIIGEIRLFYLVGIYLLLSVAGTVGGNAGGNFAHLGGALLGYMYIKLLNKGTDLGKPIQYIWKFASNLGKEKTKLKVTYRNPSKSSTDVPDQEEIDRILDKINQMGGYNALSKEEKEKLFKYSQK